MRKTNLLLQISEIKTADIPDIDLSSLGVVSYNDFTVEVIDPVLDYLELMEVCSEIIEGEITYIITGIIGWVLSCRMCLTSNLSRICFLGLISGLHISIHFAYLIIMNELFE
jgi:hypothetical protein